MSASSLSAVARKVATGGTLTEDDARDLIAATDLVTVGMISTEARRLRVGDRVTYVRVAEIAAEHAAAAPAGLSSAWPPAAAGEVRITGTPGTITGAIASVRAVALSIGANAAAGVPPITAFSLADLWSLAGSDAVKLREIAQALRAAGLIAIAEVPLDQLQFITSTSTPDAARAALEAVLGAGLLAPVATWHDAPADPVASLLALHALQERTQAFRAFAPLARVQSVSTPTTGYEDVKIVAVARAVLHNIDHIQVDWATHGPKLAQVALLFGASDLDRVSPSDDAPLGHRRAPLEEMQRNVKSAFLDPVERDGRFAQVGR